jgi:hypothetical protein
MNSNKKVLAIWSKGRTLPQYDSRCWRVDDYGYLIRLDDYGNRNSPYGWEIDHIVPDGPDYFFNLRPLNWIVNVKRN